MNFIKTQDDDVAAVLKAANFSYVNKDSNGFYIFLNDRKFEFAESDRKKMFFTNVFSM